MAHSGLYHFDPVSGAALGFGNGYTNAIPNGSYTFLLGFDTMGADQLTLFISDNGGAANVQFTIQVRWGSAGEDPNSAFIASAPSTAPREIALTALPPAGGIQRFNVNDMEWGPFTPSAAARRGWVLYFPVAQELFLIGLQGLAAPPGAQSIDFGIVLGVGSSSTNVPNG